MKLYLGVSLTVGKQIIRTIHRKRNITVETKKYTFLPLPSTFPFHLWPVPRSSDSCAESLWPPWPLWGWQQSETRPGAGPERPGKPRMDYHQQIMYRSVNKRYLEKMPVPLLDLLPDLILAPLPPGLIVMTLVIPALALGRPGLNRGYRRNDGEVLNRRGQLVLDRGKQT